MVWLVHSKARLKPVYFQSPSILRAPQLALARSALRLIAATDYVQACWCWNWTFHVEQSRSTLAAFLRYSTDFFPVHSQYVFQTRNTDLGLLFTTKWRRLACVCLCKKKEKWMLLMRWSASRRAIREVSCIILVKSRASVFVLPCWLNLCVFS